MLETLAHLSETLDLARWFERARGTSTERDNRIAETLDPWTLTNARVRLGAMTERRPHEEARAVTDPLVVRALALFEEDPGKRWTVEELGRTLGVSRPVLGRRFVAAVGAPPLRTLTRTRLGRAAELLQTTDAGLAWVADAVGYDSEFSFSRAFRRQFGLPPGHYRAQLRRLDGLQTTSALEHEMHRGVLTVPSGAPVPTSSFEATPQVTSVSTGRTVALAA